jgi:hypothetical protein
MIFETSFDDSASSDHDAELNMDVDYHSITDHINYHSITDHINSDAVETNEDTYRIVAGVASVKEKIGPIDDDAHCYESYNRVPISIIRFTTKTEPCYVKYCGRGSTALPRPDLDDILTEKNSRNSSIICSRTTTQEEQMNPKKTVKFMSIQIRLYGQTVGDNPAVSYGPPIQLDWDYEQNDDIPVEVYEATRGKRRNMKQMVLSYYHRKNLLSWQYGVMEDELKKAKKDAKKTKLKRSITRALLPIMTVELALESASRQAKQFVNRRR